MQRNSQERQRQRSLKQRQTLPIENRSQINPNADRDLKLSEPLDLNDLETRRSLSSVPTYSSLSRRSPETHVSR